MNQDILSYLESIIPCANAKIIYIAVRKNEIEEKMGVWCSSVALIEEELPANWIIN